MSVRPSFCVYAYVSPVYQTLPPPRRSSSSLSREVACQRPLLPSSPNPSAVHSPSEPHPQQRDRANWDSVPLDIISVASFNSPHPPPPPRRSPRKTKKRGTQVRQLMARVLILSLPLGALKSDYVPVGQRLRTRERQTAAKGNARGGDNSSTTDLKQAL